MNEAELREQIDNALAGVAAHDHEVDAIMAIVEPLLADGERLEVSTEALRRIDAWANAYPLSVFPEPDFEKAASALKANGMTLDSISASNMRHCVSGVGKIAADALSLTRAAEHPEETPDER